MNNIQSLKIQFHSVIVFLYVNKNVNVLLIFIYFSSNDMIRIGLKSYILSNKKFIYIEVFNLIWLGRKFI